MFQVRYLSDIAGGYALYDRYNTVQEANAAAMRLQRAFRAHGLRREASSVRVINRSNH